MEPKTAQKKNEAKPTQESSRQFHRTKGDSRNALEVYAVEPSKHPSVVVTYNDQWALIKDRYPKATVHLLLLPRDTDIGKLHPYDALNSPGILESAKPEVEKAIDIAASELRRLHGSHSDSEKPRMEALKSEDPPDELPPGRDWRKEVMAGIHTHPSMNHMHIHILSVDRYSPCLKHKKHYLSFTTDFFVPVDSFPLSTAESIRRSKLRWPDLDMVCWRCGQNFSNHFKKLKEHLEEEFFDWRKE